MKVKKILNVITLIAVSAVIFAQGSTAEQTASLEERVEKLEKASMAEYITFSGFGQVQFLNSSNESGAEKEGFNIRRMRLKMVAVPNKETSVVYQVDLANGFTTLDAYAQYAPSGSEKTGYAVRIGQIGIPFGYQQTRSTTAKENPDNANVVVNLTENLNGNVISNSPGVYFSTASNNTYSVEASVSGAAGRNKVNTNGNKALVGTVRGKGKFTDKLTGGVSLMYSKQNKDFVPFNAIDTTYLRYGIDAQYKIADNLNFMAEYIAGTDKDSVDGAQTINHNGYYGQAVYNFNDKTQSMVMYDSYKVTGTESLNTLTVGGIYKLNKNWTLRLFGKNKSGAADGNDIIFDTIISF